MLALTLSPAVELQEGRVLVCTFTHCALEPGFMNGMVPC